MAGFDISLLNAVLEGGADFAAVKRALALQMSRDPHLGISVDRADMDRSVERVLAARGVRRAVELLRNDKDETTRKLRSFLLAIAWPGAHGRMSNHLDLFLPTLRALASPEQQARWVPAAESFRMLGCFACTEIGHGSFVRGLETTATMVPPSAGAPAVFEVNTPSDTARKCWIGSGGQMATHAVVFAQVIAPVAAGSASMRRFGIGVLLVPLRDTSNGRLLPGVTAQDLGPKMGRNGLDNGILSFSHVRVPASALLSRFMTVSPAAGTVRPSPFAQLAYAALVDGRALMAHASFGMLSMALTIAVRYGARRRQFPLASAASATGPAPPAVTLALPATGEGSARVGLATAIGAESAPAPWVQSARAPSTRHAAGRLVLPAPGVSSATGTGERAILDYPLHLARLVPLTGLCFCLKGAAERVSALCQDAAAALDRKDLATLKRAHCVSAALKAEATWLAYEGIDACRQACGGFGYSAWSGLPALVADFAVMPTWEGDNHLMALQGSRLVINALRGLQAGKTPDPEVSFVSGAAAGDGEEGSAPAVGDVMDAFEAFRELPHARSGGGAATAEANRRLVGAGDAVLGAVQAVLEQSAVAMAASALSSIGGALAEGGSAAAASEGERQSLALVAVGRLWMRGWLVAAGREWAAAHLAGPKATAEALAAAAAVSRATVATGLWLLDKSAAWLAPACTRDADVTALSTAVVDASSGVRCDALGLVEAWGHSDWVLASRLGNAHGDPYKEWIHAATTSRVSGGEQDYWADTVGEVLRAAPGGAVSFQELF